MSARRWIITVWAVLCLTGITTTAALNTGSPTGQPNSPSGEPTPTGTHVMDCQEIADYVEQIRAGAERDRQEVLDPSAPAAHRGKITAETVVIPTECADVLEERGLKTH
ncbi:hypothetical protein ACFRCW_27380 [Streptomyces sp. NPDC056653]|uniref:hypothetical protein n=1 Tax=Streptomyces sp. NPDC056653 TaxID=3345894 RepID=UPI00367EB36C